MSTTLASPITKAQSVFSWNTEDSPSTEPAPVLIRLRDMSCRAENPPEAASVVADEPPRTEPEAAPVDPSPAELSAAPQTAEAAVPEPSPKSSAEPLSATAPEATSATPSRRSRQRRESPREPRSWTNTLWQGSVAFLLLSMAVIVYFIMAGGGKGQNAVGSGETPTETEHAAPDELEAPEISIPAPAPQTPEFAEAAFPEKRESLPREASSADLAPANGDFNRERETAASELTTTEQLETADNRDSAESRPASPASETSSYPVTPATATYPVTNPSLFRYPDDTRPNLSTERIGTRNPAERFAPRGNRWDERERLGGGPPGGDFQPTKMR